MNVQKVNKSFTYSSKHSTFLVMKLPLININKLLNIKISLLLSKLLNVRSYEPS